MKARFHEISLRIPKQLYKAVRVYIMRQERFRGMKLSVTSLVNAAIAEKLAREGYLPEEAPGPAKAK